MRRLVALLTVAAAVLAACSGGDGGISPTRAPEGPFGAITRLPGGTAVPADTRTLTSIICGDETLTIVTNRETLAASMPCDRMLPEAITARFVGKEVAIRHEHDRLIIESTTAGTLEFPAGEPRVTGGP